MNWQFIDDNATFELQEPQRSSHLYFPLVNESGMVSVVTPKLHGDVKTGHNAFLMQPVSVDDLHATRTGRNFWLSIEKYGAWSVMGNSAWQTTHNFGDNQFEKVTLQAGLLWHKVTRTHVGLGLQAEMTSLVPPIDDAVELLRVTLTNQGNKPVAFTATAAIPLYGRSADNLRDHRHVTSLLHRIRTDWHGVSVCPTLSFDERGHRANQTNYAVLGAEGDGTQPVGFYPVTETFIGEGGSLDWPQAIVTNEVLPVGPGYRRDGYEALGGLLFGKMTLAPGASCSYIVVLAIVDGKLNSAELITRYASATQFDHWLATTQAYWQDRVANFTVATGDARFDNWLKWVAVQPILRRLCGNSFLPYHDYGRGGRGWRDLWQDLLALMLMEQESIRPMLLSNFGGVRLDGSNATIIGSAPGEFIADRNNIPRVWMDHGAWPLLTVQLYLDRTGDTDLLLEQQAYFKDRWTHRAQVVDEAWQAEQGTQQRTQDGAVYSGTVLEHLLVQHLTAFLHVGEHNIMRLEGGDWNDGLDMADERGESVAFTALYAGNLRQLAALVRTLAARGHVDIVLAAEIGRLLTPVDTNSIADKLALLKTYFESVQHTLSGDMMVVSAEQLATDLDAKAASLVAHLRQQEWVEDAAGHGWYNGYYDNDGQRVEGDHPRGTRMTLTGQVFALLGGVATDEQVQAIVDSAETYLHEPAVGGYKLNTDFGDVLTNLGRLFGFAYGHKENGAMFTHMAVMYANALYQRGFALEGHRVLQELFVHSQNFAVSRMYPGLPEYVSDTGRGMYPYLTGSASWYILTVLQDMFGVRGVEGDLMLQPNLAAEQFDDENTASVKTLFAGRRWRITFVNGERLDIGRYRVDKVSIDGHDIPVVRQQYGALVERAELNLLSAATEHHITVTLIGIEQDMCS